ncbi:MAG TPA: hypothetical protein VFL98_02745 [Candidatus Paceibacterota bacterium]|nr:hypothetical protein [Candidatus Paceibacterota bacterium]
MAAIPAQSKKASQDFVPVNEVRDGVVMLKDGGMRAILMASSINFALKSDDEQTAFIIQFQNFLNSLDFSVQMFVESRTLDIRPYTDTLEASLKNQLDDLMRVQIREYIQFVKSFTEAANIMTKNFFIIVPYDPPVVNTKSQGGLLSALPFGGKAKTTADATFEENLSQLEQRMSVVQQGLMRSGVRTVPLGSEETIELLYKLFNPGEQDKPMDLAAMNASGASA